MHVRLASLAPRLKAIAPIAITTAAVMTAATGASAVTVRLHPPTPAAKVAAAPAKPGQATLSLPAPPAPAADPPSAETSASRSTAGRSDVVLRPKRLIEASLLVTSPIPLTARQLSLVRATSGVHQVQTVTTGRALVDGHHASLLGVDPSRFRPWTPKLTAASQPLWQSIARGELTASFDMGHQANLPLGNTVPLRANHRAVPVRIGAFASVGMAGVDAVVSRSVAASLGLRDRTGVVLSAPHADPLQLRRTLLSELGPHVHAVLLRQVIVIRDSGEFLTRAQINTVLQTAAHQVGKPYVWGAEGPNSFDCSGLVQWSFAAAGIRMPRVSQQQWFAGPHVDYSHALPGDLLFWHYDPTDPTDIDHVAIYAGNGMMLVAPHTGDFVKYVPVPLTNLAGVVRVDPAMAAQIAW
ncbi:MAG TPA: C40 family peptidase [Mycobacteriales bacterium]|nr:C40 family peptidase [Mycobacteriales bacterium]